ncbi:predicted protein [Plenodomus lingam JN3]|uniref:Predicted protein n=1 Tax=Leptosphaeria maculans (strain JN3 / isolate v23.1.3 / race Av1-4-5-6-7-8) TaxID=985895 RepID=E5ADV4_LEPMJ|nr:predicted protein [Plenodomus lingam JN3]CBY01393.1 predicted protein [Plenodomus lingam JN3]
MVERRRYEDAVEPSKAPCTSMELDHQSVKMPLATTVTSS